MAKLNWARVNTENRITLRAQQNPIAHVATPTVFRSKYAGKCSMCQEPYAVLELITHGAVVNGKQTYAHEDCTGVRAVIVPVEAPKAPKPKVRLCKTTGCKAWARKGMDLCQYHSGNTVAKLSKAEQLERLEEKKAKGYISNYQYQTERAKLDA